MEEVLSGKNCRGIAGKYSFIVQKYHETTGIKRKDVVFEGFICLFSEMI